MNLNENMRKLINLIENIAVLGPCFKTHIRTVLYNEHANSLILM